MTDDSEYKYFHKIDEGYLSVSPFFGKIEEIDGKKIDQRTRRVSMKLGDSAGLAIDKKVETKDGLEIHLRTTEKGEQEVKAYFHEDSKQVQTLTIQRWMTKTGNPLKANYIVLYGEQLSLLLKFVKAYEGIPSIGSGKMEVPLKVALEKAQEKQQINNEMVIEYLKKNPSLIKSIVENEIDESDVISLGYRKKQLNLFKELLYNDEFFNSEKNRLGNNKKNEDVWQDFFEKNTWIFGYGLNYYLNMPLEGNKLEQIVKGYDFHSTGKRVDALLKTQGIISSLSFGEIKTHKTPLLHKTKEAYRTECWRASEELSGGIAQVQKTVQISISNIKSKTEVKDRQGNLTGEQLFLYQPKSFLIIGSLSQFEGEYGINEDKFSSFELFRKQINNTEIITFDELYERAKHIVESSSQKT